MNELTFNLCVPWDSTALACGAKAVAEALLLESAQRGLPVSIKRTGSRGLFWVEPLVEAVTPNGRIGFGPLTPADVSSLLDALRADPSRHARYLGRVDELPYLRNQARLTFARVGIIDPLSLDEYRAHSGFDGLQRALDLAPEAIVKEVMESGLRGRGGAAFPAGVKWQTVQKAQSDTKYIVCNADEGDSGTFADRMLMEGDPLVLIEGMTIAGLAVGATQGYIYCRSEYPFAIATLQAAIGLAREKGYLGDNILGSHRAFDLDVRLGAGAYICGEETALLESLEGKRGMVRAKPPLPALSGLFGRPTVVNNVITLCSVPLILLKGARFYSEYGMGRSRGTMPFQLAGNIKRGGLVESAFGLTLRELIEDFGGGTASGRPVRAVQVGGPLGAYVPASKLDTPLDYEAFTAIGAMLGHGGVVVFDDTVDMGAQARFAMEFCAIESCGKCTPCRIGATRGVEVIDRIRAGQDTFAQVALLRDLCDTMLSGSLCALGGMAPFPVLSALDHFPEDFVRSARAAA